MQSQTTGRRQQTLADVLAYIVRFKRMHDGNSPSLREIAEACALSGPSVALYRVRDLQAGGALRLTADRFAKQRIEVVGGRWTYDES